MVPNLMLTGTELVIAGLAAFAAGIINALAGGGTLISFPTLVALGVPELSANITNTVALCPGYLGGTIAQKEDLKGQKRRLWVLLPAGIIGGITGAILLIVISDQVFRVLVPFLVIFASLLLAVQEPVRQWVINHSREGRDDTNGIKKAALPVGLTAVYGGYFGAGQSVIVLSVLGVFLEDSLTRLNALKQSLTLCSNVAAAVFLLFSGMVIWPVAIVMAAGALLGGAAGGKFAGRINPTVLRWTVVTIGLLVGIILLVNVIRTG
jgi:uncharacterized membrane protein YfcA